MVERQNVSTRRESVSGPRKTRALVYTKIPGTVQSTAAQTEGVLQKNAAKCSSQVVETFLLVCASCLYVCVADEPPKYVFICNLVVPSIIFARFSFLFLPH